MTVSTIRSATIMEPPSTPNCEPFSSLTALRRANGALTRRRQSKGGEPPSLEEILDFMRRIRVTGRHIASEVGREVAQTILDYWYGLALRESREQSGFAAVAAMTLDPYVAGSAVGLEAEEEADENEQASRQFELLKQKASASFAESDVDAVRRLATRMFAITEVSGEVVLAQLNIEDPALSSFRCQKLLEQLNDAGVLRAEGENSRVLADRRLLFEVQELGAVVKERISLRELTLGWWKADSDPQARAAALLGAGSKLDKAVDFQDTTPEEDEFLRQSRAAVSRKRMVSFLATILLVLMCMLFLVYVKFKEITKAQKDLKSENTVLSATEQKLKKDNTEISLQNQRLETQFQDALRSLNAAPSQSAEIAILKERVGRFGKDLQLLADQLKPSIYSLPGSIQKIVIQWQTKDNDASPSNDAVVQSLSSTPAANTPVMLGTTVTSNRVAAVRGSLGVYVRDPASGKIYLAGPKYLLSGKKGDLVYAGSAKPLVVARISDRVPLEVCDFKNLVLAELIDPATADNSLFGVGHLARVTDSKNVTSSTLVALVGSGSGYATGKVKEQDSSGLIATTSISTAGDGGAPVIVLDKKAPENSSILGILVSKSEDGRSSYVQPLDIFLKKNGLELYKPMRSGGDDASNPFSGVLAEIFVNNSDPAFIKKALPYLQALQKAGITFPVPEPQPKTRSPATTTEVRYFYPDDATIAAQVMKRLKEANFPSSIRVSFVDDSTAPRKFVQISVAKNGFK